MLHCSKCICGDHFLLPEKQLPTLHLVAALERTVLLRGTPFKRSNFNKLYLCMYLLSFLAPRVISILYKMQDEHRKVIQNNFSSLVEQTDLDAMVNILYEKGVFSERMIEPYRDTSKDVRMRKRDLYMDITRRGPEAYQNLLDSLIELGYWHLARCLDPNSPYNPIPTVHPGLEPNTNDQFVSISDERHKTNKSKSTSEKPPMVPGPTPKDPHINVVRSTSFFDDNGSELKVYQTRGRKRGALLMYNYASFSHGSEESRAGSDVDCANLKYLFGEIGFTPRVYPDYTKKETLQTLLNLKESLVGFECVFVVVSSHGYERAHSSDTDFRCSDGQLISCRELIRYFNNTDLPQLKGIPKVFIFQICRGTQDDLGPGASVVVDAGRADDDRGRPDTGRGRADDESWPAPAADHERAYSDILIAHSTLPGYVSHRDKTLGSWYIQVLCSVFAARAHDTHVHKLLTMADEELRRRYPVQTSSVDSWGFNRRLYLHPGLFED